MRVRVYNKEKNEYFKSEVYAVVNSGYYERQLVLVPSQSGGYLKFFDYLDKTDKLLPVLINTIFPQRPSEWIYKKTNTVQEKFVLYSDLLKADVLFFEYIGFSWLWNDTDTLTRLLHGESVLLCDSIFEGNVYSDISQPGWNFIESQEDADAFQTEVCGFHDSVIKELHYISGAYVRADKCMFPSDDKRSILVQMQSQQCRNFEMEFQGVTALNLRPAADNYSGDIFDASLLVQNASILFCNRLMESVDSTDTDTWITAYSLKWRFTE